MTRQPVRHRPLRLAHRGDWRRVPENTLPALLAALRLPGCDGVEFDVRRAADGTPVLLHDPTLERTHGRLDRVVDLPIDLLQGLGIPSLEAVLRTLPERAFVDVELKGDPGSSVVAVLDAGRGDGGSLANAVVSSFEPATLAAIGRARPGWPRWLNAIDLTRATLGLARELGCRGVSVHWRAIHAESMGAASQAGLEVAAWTVRRRPTFRRLARHGVVAICAEGAALDG